jgi:hypothetical protein
LISFNAFEICTAHDPWFRIQLSDQGWFWVFTANEERVFPCHYCTVSLDRRNASNDKLQVDACMDYIAFSQHALLERRPRQLDFGFAVGNDR